MSAVVITPTHIASDHGVVTETLPLSFRSDKDHKKIFMNEDQTLFLGICGNYDPATMELPVVWDLLEHIYQTFVKESEHETTCRIKDKVLIALFKDLFPDTSDIALVSVDTRIAVKFDKVFKNIAIKRLGDYWGLGTGGKFAAGIMEREKDFIKVFNTLPLLDSLCSSDFTCFPLSMLKPFVHKTTGFDSDSEEES